MPRFGIILVHGMTEHAACYDSVAQWVVDQGGVAIAADQVGHGPSCKGPLGALGAGGWAALVRRFQTVVTAAITDRPNIPWVILGHSMGSFVVQDGMARLRVPVAGLVLTGATFVSRIASGMGRVVSAVLGLVLGQNGSGQLLDQLTYGRFNRAFAPNRTPFDWLSRNPAIVDGYINDPYCGFVPPVSFYRALFGGIHHLFKPAKLTQLMPTPILILSGAQDPVTQFGRGARRLAQQYRDQGHSAVDVVIFPNLRHVILTERDNDIVYRQLADFIQRVTGLGAI